MESESSRDGLRFAVPKSRRLTADLLAFHRSVPLCAHDRLCRLGPVNAARQNCRIRISWAALFLKAYGLVARRIPELRQIWYRFPWAHVYQHPESHGILTVQREYQGEPWLFWGKVRAPENQPLELIQSAVDRFTSGDPESVFRGQLQLASVPLPLRRAIWWWNLNIATRARARRVGTFFLSTLAGRGAEIRLPPSVQTGCLSYGPLDEQMLSRVTLAYDHRLMDGALIAEALAGIEAELNTALTEELGDVSDPGSAET